MDYISKELTNITEPLEKLSQEVIKAEKLQKPLNSLGTSSTTKTNKNSTNSLLTDQVKSRKKKYVKASFDGSLLQKYNDGYKNFVDLYKTNISKREVEYILKNKTKQLAKTKIEIADEVNALVNFYYRHFQVLIPKRDLKKLFMTSYSQHQNCSTFCTRELETHMKNQLSNLKKRILKVESIMSHPQLPNLDMLSKNFDINPFKRVLVMDDSIEPYLKKVAYEDDKSFALVMYSESKVKNILQTGFEHVFIDGTKSYIPFDQSHQLLFINFKLNNGQTTTGISVLVKGSSKKCTT